MFILLFVIFLGIIVAIWVLMGLRDRNHQFANMTADDMVRTAAQQVLPLMAACSVQPPGTYNAKQLASNYPDIPAGGHWVCQVTAGGTSQNGTTVVLYTSAPASHWGVHGNQPSAHGGNNPLQTQYAWSVAGELARIAAGTKGAWIAGEVDANDASATLHPISGGPGISLRGNMPAPLPYATPVIVMGAQPSSGV